MKCVYFTSFCYPSFHSNKASICFMLHERENFNFSPTIYYDLSWKTFLFHDFICWLQMLTFCIDERSTKEVCHFSQTAGSICFMLIVHFSCSLTLKKIKTYCFVSHGFQGKFMSSIPENSEDCRSIA